MNSLFIFPIRENNFDSHETFEIDKLRRDLREIKGVYNLREENCEGQYRFQDSETLFTLSNDLQRFSCRPENAASYNLALELQKRETRPLRAVNTSYDFDLILTEIKSLTDFQEKINSEIYSEAA
jgi:hypothetical protein